MTSPKLMTALHGQSYRTERPFFTVTEGAMTDVACTPDGHIHVLLRFDTLTSTPTADLIELSATGEMRACHNMGFADAHMMAPAKDGSLWVVDRDAHEVVHVRHGERIGTIGTRHGPGQPFNHPTGIAIAADGSIFVCEGYAGHSVWRFGPDGRELGRWGSFGTGRGQFRNAHALWVTDDDRVAVVDRENGRVQIFDLDGILLSVLEGFHGPLDVWGDAAGNLFVSDLFPSLTMISPDGRVLGRSRPVLNGAHGLFGSPTGEIYFAESNPNRISRIVPVSA